MTIDERQRAAGNCGKSNSDVTHIFEVHSEKMPCKEPYAHH